MLSDQTVYLVSCVSKKRATATLAKDLYISEWFRRARRYVEATGCRWYILSDKHGLVAPDQMLAPYEQSMKTTGVADRRAWARRVQTQMDHQAPNAKHFVILAGQRYREFLMEYFRRRGSTVEVPLEGLRIGEQLSWLGRHTAYEPSYHRHENH